MVVAEGDVGGTERISMDDFWWVAVKVWIA